MTRTCMVEGFTTCMNGTPGRTWSPSCTSPIVPCFQIVFSTTTPSIGDLICIRSALAWACSMVCCVRSR